MTKPRIQVFIEHDIIIRHFLHSGTIQRLEDDFEVQYVFPENHNRVTTDVETLGLTSCRRIPVDAQRLGALRDLAKVEALRRARRNPDFTFLNTNLKLIFQPSYYKYLRRSSQWPVYPFYKRRVLRDARNYPELEQAIDEFQPDLVIHPSVLEGLFITDLTSTTKKRGIPFLVLMNSWDNPSTKSLVIDPPDRLWVWGEQTKGHAINFMGIEPSRVHVGGAAQFEVYREDPIWTKVDLLNKLGLPSHARLIVYAGASKNVDEMSHLKMLDEACASGSFGNTHVMFRPHPWRAARRDEEDFFEIPWRRVHMDPTMRDQFNRPGSSDSARINLSDYRDTHAVLSAADVLVSSISTIMLEAAIHGVPTVGIAIENEIKDNVSLKAAHQSLYFVDLFERLHLPKCRDIDSLREAVRSELERSSKPEERRTLKDKCRWFVEMGDDPYPVRLGRFAEELISKAS